MHSRVKFAFWGLLVLADVARAQQLDPIVNMCVRFHHQCKCIPAASIANSEGIISHKVAVVKNNTLYIDGGRETFVDVTGSGSSTKQMGHITEGYSRNFVPLSKQVRLTIA